MKSTNSLIYLLCLLLPALSFGQFCDSEEHDEYVEGNFALLGSGDRGEIEVGIAFGRRFERERPRRRCEDREHWDRHDHDDNCRCVRRGLNYSVTQPGTRVYDLTYMHDDCREELVEEIMVRLNKKFNLSMNELFGISE